MSEEKKDDGRHDLSRRNFILASSTLAAASALNTAAVMPVAQAQSLAVSLKVDSKTSLFLQLTTQQGHIEASVRCEAGDAGALGEHWEQLQESLARQNVHLLPLEDAPASSNTPFEPASESGRNFQGGSGSQNEPPRTPAPEVEKSSEDALDAALDLTKPKSKSRHYHGWEKWA